MIRYKFSRKRDEDFWKILRSRVNEYFVDNNINRDANQQMFIKTIMLFTLYLTPYFLLLFSGITHTWELISLWILLGLGKAFIGTSVMHDALHGSYSKNKMLNNIASISAMLLGVDSKVWQIQHNVIHHTYTNVEDTDEDILPRFVFRFSENQPKRWFHRYQHLYAPIFYCVPLLEWITTKDFVKIFDYKNLNFIKEGKDFRKEFTLVVLKKFVYYILFLALPIYMIQVPVMTTVWMIIASHAITGIMLAAIFQTAHVLPNTAMVKIESDQIDKSWAAHQLFTTSNYGMNNKILTWFLGGLNFQVEHHLFPDICHVHYPKIAKIVQKTTAEYDLPYLYHPTFRAALIGHYQHLKAMGK